MWRRDNDIEQMIRSSAEAFAEAEHGMTRVRRCSTSAEGFDRGVWLAMAELGWTGILLPERDGGTGLQASAAFVLAEVFGQRLMPEPFVASAVIAATVLGGSNTSCARNAAMRLAQGLSTITLAHSETDSLAELQPASSINMVDGNLRLVGNKPLVASWSKDDTFLVTAMWNGNLAIAAVPADTQGISATPHRMADGSIATDLFFDDVAVSEDQLIACGAEAKDLLTLAISRGILAISAQLEGQARSMLRMTIDYVNQRVQFGRPLGTNQALRHNVVNLFAQVELAGAAWRQAAALVEEQGPVTATRAISSAKARCSDAAVAVAKAAIQYHGAFGYTEEADVGLFVNSTLRLSSWLGSSGQHRERALRVHDMKDVSVG